MKVAHDVDFNTFRVKMLYTSRVTFSQITSTFTFSVNICSHLAAFSHIEAFSHLRVPHTRAFTFNFDATLASH